MKISEMDHAVTVYTPAHSTLPDDVRVVLLTAQKLFGAVPVYVVSGVATLAAQVARVLALGLGSRQEPLMIRGTPETTYWVVY